MRDTPSTLRVPGQSRRTSTYAVANAALAYDKPFAAPAARMLCQWSAATATRSQPPRNGDAKSEAKRIAKRGEARLLWDESGAAVMASRGKPNCA